MLRLNLFGGLIFLVSLSGFTNNNMTKPAHKICLDVSLKYNGENARSVWLGATMPKQVWESVQALQEKIKSSGIRGGEYEPKERLHVTLKYLGKIAPGAKPETAISEALKDIAITRLTMKITKIGILYNKDKSPRLIWAEVQSEDLNRLHDSLENALASFCDRDGRAYKAHITLFHFGKTKGIPDWLAQKVENIAVDIPEFQVNGFKFLETPQSSLEPWIVLQRYKIKS